MAHLINKQQIHGRGGGHVKWDNDLRWQNQLQDDIDEITTVASVSGASDITTVNTKKEERVLKMHIVPHTHDDVGWLKTVEQYYYGLNNTVQEACVKSILDTVIQELQVSPDRKFTYVEMAFFTMWWEEQTPETKQIVHNLVQNKQLSFVNGGWCMHDEATTHYMGMIDQTTLGHDFLKREFNFTPRVAWQLDPFGHSSTQASLLGTQAGFDAIYFGRIDYQDRNLRQSTQNCEGFWDTSPDPTVSDPIFFGLTGEYNGNYGAPDEFCFDDLCNHKEHIIGLNKTVLFNRVFDFMKAVKTQTDRTRGDNVMLTMGSDFQYSNATVNFMNLDLLIQMITTHEQEYIKLLFGSKSSVEGLESYEYDRIDVFYSTPEMYTDYKYQELIDSRKFSSSTSASRDNDHMYTSKAGESPFINGMNFETKTDDFFPYSDCEHCFWTGYFTSRPSLKKLERVGSAFLQVARQVQSLYVTHNDGTTTTTGTESTSTIKGSEEIYELEKAMGVMQHHDGVSGTSKQHVAYDYAKKVQSGINEVASFITDVMKMKFTGLSNIAFCQLRNESICEISQDATAKDDEIQELYVVLYNAIGQTANEIVSLPVSSNSAYIVEKNQKDDSNDNWKIVKSALVPNDQHAQGGKSSPFNLWFDSESIPPISMTLFRIRADESSGSSIRSSSSNVPITEQRKLSATSYTDEDIKVQIHDGSRISISMKDDISETEMLSLEWGYYKSFPGNATDQQASGAYIFRPETPNEDYQFIAASSVSFVKSLLFTEVHIGFEVPWVKMVVRMYEEKQFIEMEYAVGPIDIDDGVGKEVVARFRSGVNNRGVFYTDSNGREFIKRKRSERNTWKLEEFEPIAGNYYPVNAAIYIEDDKASLAVLTDRSQGGSSLQDGAVELMVHRRTTHDDNRGVSEPMDETDGGMTPYEPYGHHERLGKGILINGKFRILRGPGKSGAVLARCKMDQMFSPMHVFAATAKPPHLNQPQIVEKASEFKSTKTISLPKNLQLTTLKLMSVSDGVSTFLIRIGHAYGYGESKDLSIPVSVDLSQILLDFNVENIAERTLTGNRGKEDWLINKLKWASDQSHQKTLDIQGGNYTVVIHPMEIRTFLVNAKKMK